jgi:uncharacterized protein
MNVFVMGGTGLVGKRLVQRLCQRHDRVTVLTRRPEAARTTLPADCTTIVEGDPMQPGSWIAAIKDCDAIINLVGEPILGRRWDDPLKALLRDSRVQSTANAVRALAEYPRTSNGPGRTLVNASAIGYYGPRGDEALDEDAAPGNDLLARLTVEWEATARQAENEGIRVVCVRLGVVLDREGGPMQMMLPPFKLGLGGPIGSGRQWTSWIHHQDAVGLFMLALDKNQAMGPLNGTAPNPVTNKDFAKALGRALHRPAFLPVPAFALRLRFGEVAGVLTTGQRVIPKKALEFGYRFDFPTIDVALADMLKQKA